MLRKRKNPVGIYMLDLFKLLADREWHAFPELLGLINGKIRPEDAAEFFVNHAQTRDLEFITTEGRIQKGKALILRHLISATVAQGAIERDGSKGDEAQVRWVRWYCWRCGASVGRRFVRPPHGLCESCEKVKDAEPCQSNA